MPGFEGSHKFHWQCRSSKFYTSKFTVSYHMYGYSACKAQTASVTFLLPKDFSTLTVFCVLTMASFALFLPIKGQVNLYLQQYCWLNSPYPRPPGHIPVLLTPLLTRLSETQSMERIQPKAVLQPAVWSGALTQQQEQHKIVRECQGAGFSRQPGPQTPMCKSGFHHI